MLGGHLAALYERLWSLSDQAAPPCRCFYRPWGFLARRYGAEGEQPMMFFPHVGELSDAGVWVDVVRPAIWIARDPVPVRNFRPDVVGASLEELFGLAHERGHERSWREGTHVSSEASTDGPRILDEERRAWRYAVELLGELDREAAGALEAMRARALASYETKFGPRGPS